MNRQRAHFLVMNAPAEERRASSDGEGPGDEDGHHHFHPASPRAAAMPDEEHDDGQESCNARRPDEEVCCQVVLVDQCLVDAGDWRIRMRYEIRGAVTGQIRRDAAERRDDAHDQTRGDEFAPRFDQSEEHQAEREQLAVQRRVVDGEMDVNGAEINAPNDTTVRGAVSRAWWGQT